MSRAMTSAQRDERRAAPSRSASPGGLSPDVNSPVDCSRLAKGWAARPSAVCKTGERTRSTRG